MQGFFFTHIYVLFASYLLMSVIFNLIKKCLLANVRRLDIHVRLCESPRLLAGLIWLPAGLIWGLREL
jgi:hypothetical protein